MNYVLVKTETKKMKGGKKKKNYLRLWTKALKHFMGLLRLRTFQCCILLKKWFVFYEHLREEKKHQKIS